MNKDLKKTNVNVKISALTNDKLCGWQAGL